MCFTPQGERVDHPSIVDLQPGTLFHRRYRVVRRVKAGNMGAIYEVADDKTRSRRALKVMLPDLVEHPDLRSRFELEAQVTGDIESDHLVRVSDAGIDDATGTPFLVMDLLRGEELGSLLRKQKALPPGEVVLYLRQAARALDKTHAAGIVHRDLKPENMFVTRRDDDSPCVKILDFGIAKVVEQSQKARTTQALGTPLYMSPEQIRGDREIGPRADIYALGHVAYALLVGEPYWAEEASLHEAIFPFLSTVLGGVVESPRDRAQRRRGVSMSTAFDAWFRKATAPRPEDRFDRATTAVAALADVLGMTDSHRSVSSPDAYEATQLPMPSEALEGTVPLRGSVQPSSEPSSTVPLPTLVASPSCTPKQSSTTPLPTLVASPSRPPDQNSTVPLPTLHRGAHRSSRGRGTSTAPTSTPTAGARASRVLPRTLGALLVVGAIAIGVVVLRDRVLASPEAPALPGTTELAATDAPSAPVVVSVAPLATQGASLASSQASTAAEPPAPPTTMPRAAGLQPPARPALNAGRAVPRDAPRATLAATPDTPKVDGPRDGRAATPTEQQKPASVPSVTSAPIPPID
ncbi:protein kinase [Sorangium sp. So ce118]